MIIYPAIDLKDNKCVRLYQGKMDRATIYNDDPASQAQAFIAEGADWLHIVDLDGAISGVSKNTHSIEKIICQCPDIKIQLGGGIRSLANIKHWLEAGVSRVILGTIAIEKPDLVLEACNTFPDQIVVGVDAYGEKVATKGWVEATEHNVFDIVNKFSQAGTGAGAGAGVSNFIYTDITRDGTHQGINLSNTSKLASSTNANIIASGGVASLDDIIKIKQAGNISGVIVGRALYDNKFKLSEALKAVS
jgi:phosphoribosylformimino-5-aminoimidazole carboxamide ribotide isomerase